MVNVFHYQREFRCRIYIYRPTGEKANSQTHSQRFINVIGDGWRSEMNDSMGKCLAIGWWCGGNKGGSWLGERQTLVEDMMISLSNDRFSSGLRSLYNIAATAIAYRPPSVLYFPFGVYKCIGSGRVYIDIIFLPVMTCKCAERYGSSWLARVGLQLLAELRYHHNIAGPKSMVATSGERIVGRREPASYARRSESLEGKILDGSWTPNWTRETCVCPLSFTPCRGVTIVWPAKQYYYCIRCSIVNDATLSAPLPTLQRVLLQRMTLSLSHFLSHRQPLAFLLSLDRFLIRPDWRERVGDQWLLMSGYTPESTQSQPSGHCGVNRT